MMGFYKMQNFALEGISGESMIITLAEGRRVSSPASFVFSGFQNPENGDQFAVAQEVFKQVVAVSECDMRNANSSAGGCGHGFSFHVVV